MTTRNSMPHNPLSPVPAPLRSGTVAALLTALTLSGCATLSATAPDTAPPPVPAAWSVQAATTPVSAQASSLADWWQRFDDAELSALIHQALLANADVRSARAALQQARAQQDVQAATTGPSIGASASAQRSKSGNADAGNRFQAGFDASWEPDVFGANRSATQASEADTLAAQTSLADVQVSLAAEVAVNHIEVRGLQARLGIARSNLAAQTETLQITRWRAQAGLASSLDVEQAVAASEQTAAQIPALQTSLAQSLNSLSVLTGQAPGTLQGAPGPTADRAAAIPLPRGDIALAFPAETLRQRADVRAAEYRVAAARARVTQADAARYPSFNLSGSIGLSALTLGGLTNGASVLNSLLASVSAPLFDGGAGQARVRVQEASLEQTRASYQATVLAALKEVEDALVALQGDRQRLQRLQTAAGAAANADLLARQRYASGLIDFRAVLDTQRTLLSAQDSVASTQASLSTDHVRLYKALGGGWTPDTEPPSPATASRP